MHGTHFRLLPFGSERRMCPAQHGHEGDGGGDGEPGAWVLVAAAGRGGARGLEHGGVLWAQRVSEGAASYSPRDEAPGGPLRRTRLVIYPGFPYDFQVKICMSTY